jgi:hypothetical protein
MFKSISENRIRKNINFGKRFPKTVCEGKIGISEGLKETLGGGRREKILFFFSKILSSQSATFLNSSVKNKMMGTLFYLELIYNTLYLNILSIDMSNQQLNEIKLTKI